MMEKVIQEFIEQEALEKQQVEVSRAKLKAFEAELPKSQVSVGGMLALD
jgi:hypothetical protein